MKDIRWEQALSTYRVGSLSPPAGTRTWHFMGFVGKSLYFQIFARNIAGSRKPLRYWLRFSPDISEEMDRRMMFSKNKLIEVAGFDDGKAVAKAILSREVPELVKRGGVPLDEDDRAWLVSGLNPLALDEYGSQDDDEEWTGSKPPWLH